MENENLCETEKMTIVIKANQPIDYISIYELDKILSSIVGNENYKVVSIEN